MEIWWSHPFAKALPAEQFEQFRRRARIHSLQRGELLVLEGEPCSSVYWAAEGRLRVVKSSQDGREQTLTEALPGQALNLVPALDGGLMPATIVAATRAKVFSLSVHDLDALLETCPVLCRVLLRELAVRLREQTALAADLALRSVGERLARLIVSEALRAGGLYTTQREIASRLGTVREVVARELARFEERGWVKLGRGTVEVLDIEALQELGCAK